MSRHATPGRGGFFRDLAVFSLKVLFWGVIVFGGVLLVPKLLGGSTDTTTTSTTITTVTTAVSVGDTSTTETAETIIEQSTTTSASTTSQTVAVRDPSEVRVQVLNSTSRDGIAAALSETLASRGYQMLDSDNYSEALDTTRVWFAPGFEREAEVLASDLPDAIVELAPNDLDVDILVVVGASYEA